MPLSAIIPIAVVVSLVYASVFEWVYHRYWLHRPWLPPQMFTAHTLVHHQLCKHDDTFHVHDEEQEEALTFQWWAGPVLVSIMLAPFLTAWALLGPRLAPAHPLAITVTAASVFFAYYLAYEGFHFLMHKPTIRGIEQSAFFKFLERHHRMHHAHMGRNFNVVFPLADAMFGTLMLRDPLAPRRTEPNARRIARRHSEYGKKLRAQGQAVEAPEPAEDPLEPAGHR